MKMEDKSITLVIGEMFYQNYQKEFMTGCLDWLEEGVVGADAIFACLGPALEIFSHYSSVEKASGEKVELREYLE